MPIKGSTSEPLKSTDVPENGSDSEVAKELFVALNPDIKIAYDKLKGKPSKELILDTLSDLDSDQLISLAFLLAEKNPGLVATYFECFEISSEHHSYNIALQIAKYDGSFFMMFFEKFGLDFSGQREVDGVKFIYEIVSASEELYLDQDMMDFDEDMALDGAAMFKYNAVEKLVLMFSKLMIKSSKSLDLIYKMILDYDKSLAQKFKDLYL